MDDQEQLEEGEGVAQDVFQDEDIETEVQIGDENDNQDNLTGEDA
jgi:hypothetical protein